MPEEILERARATFAAYRVALGSIRADPYPGELPQDPTYLSWTLAAVAPLPLHERQTLLEAEDAVAPAGDGHRPVAHRAARDERDPVPARHRGGQDPLVPELTRVGEMAKKRAGRYAGHGCPGPGRVAFALHEYTHDPRAASYGLEAAEALGLDPARVFKTLMASVDGSLAVAVVPVSGQLDLKALARALGGSRATMADQAAAERATGYVVGGISPDRSEAAPPDRGGQLGD